MTDVLVVEDEALVGIGLKMILEMTGGFQVVTSGRLNARAAAGQHHPAVVLLDAQTVCLDGMALLSQFRTLAPRPAVAMLTTLAAPDLVLDALRGGAVGFLLKDSQPEQLVAAVRALAAGSTVLAPEATSVILQSGCHSLPSADGVKQLSDREQMVLKLLGAGMTNGEISRQLFLRGRASRRASWSAGGAGVPSVEGPGLPD